MQKSSLLIKPSELSNNFEWFVIRGGSVYSLAREPCAQICVVFMNDCDSMLWSGKSSFWGGCGPHLVCTCIVLFLNKFKQICCCSCTVCNSRWNKSRYIKAVKCRLVLCKVVAGVASVSLSFHQSHMYKDTHTHTHTHTGKALYYKITLHANLFSSVEQLTW